MSALFAELDHAVTPMGDLSLRRRRILSLDLDVFEVKLGDEYLMSSLFTAGEEALASLALGALDGRDLRVLVGGLGLGHTAHAALKDPRTESVLVVEALEPVIDWHRRGLVPLGHALTGNPRCSLVHADFFRIFDEVDRPLAFEPDTLFDAILLDIDHSPQALLAASHSRFYSKRSLSRVAGSLRQGGVFAMWSDAAPDSDFVTLLATAFLDVDARAVEFDNPLQSRTASCTIYLARTARRTPQPALSGHKEISVASPSRRLTSWRPSEGT